MSDKLKFILKTASDLLQEYNGRWEGDANDFVTASAGSLDEERNEWLTTGDVESFADASYQGEVPSCYDWIRCEKKKGENYFTIEEPFNDGVVSDSMFCL